MTCAGTRRGARATPAPSQAHATGGRHTASRRRAGWDATATRAGAQATRAGTAAASCGHCAGAARRGARAAPARHQAQDTSDGHGNALTGTAQRARKRESEQHKAGLRRGGGHRRSKKTVRRGHHKDSAAAPQRPTGQEAAERRRRLFGGSGAVVSGGGDPCTLTGNVSARSIPPCETGGAAR
jgi:hypothetical protein